MTDDKPRGEGSRKLESVLGISASAFWSFLLLATGLIVLAPGGHPVSVTVAVLLGVGLAVPAVHNLRRRLSGRSAPW